MVIGYNENDIRPRARPRGRFRLSEAPTQPHPGKGRNPRRSLPNEIPARNKVLHSIRSIAGTWGQKQGWRGGCVAAQGACMRDLRSAIAREAEALKVCRGRNMLNSQDHSIAMEVAAAVCLVLAGIGGVVVKKWFHKEVETMKA